MKPPPAESVPPVPEGSAAFYGALFCPPEHRPALTALLALERELEHVTGRPGDPSIAMIRLDWWAEELQRLGAGAPRHPITRTLGGSDVATCDLQPLSSMVQISRRLRGDAGLTRAARVELDCQRSSALYGFMATWLAGSQLESPDALRDAGHRIGAGVRLTSVATDPATQNTTAHGSHAAVALGDGLAAIPALLRVTQTPLIVIAVLALRRLRIPGGGPAPTSRAGRAFDSLGMIMTAWRAALAASRGRLPASARNRTA